MSARNIGSNNWRHDLFSVVEIEVGSRCNRRCSYCPVSLDPHPAVPILMPQGVFNRLTTGLRELGFRGRISYHFYNEPLLRRDLALLVGQMRAAVPDALQVLYTNGDRLTDELFSSLRIAGIDYFLVTLHDDIPFSSRPFQIVQRSTELKLTNRAGRLTHLPLPSTLDLQRPCFAPSEMLIVTVTGDVVICYEDSERTEVMGNIVTKSLFDIWFDSRWVAIRKELRLGNRRGATKLCQRCSNVAHDRPGLSLIDEPLRLSAEHRLDATQLKATSEEARRRGE